MLLSGLGGLAEGVPFAGLVGLADGTLFSGEGGLLGGALDDRARCNGDARTGEGLRKEAPPATRGVTGTDGPALGEGAASWEKGEAFDCL